MNVVVVQSEIALASTVIGLYCHRSIWPWIFWSSSRPRSPCPGEIAPDARGGALDVLRRWPAWQAPAWAGRPAANQRTT